MNLLKNAIISYRTTLTGVAILIAVAVKAAQNGAVTGDDILAVLAGFGLIQAKDANVTGAVK
jgi:hypothetical protein